MADARPAAVSAAAVLLLAVGGWAAYATDLLRTHPARAATPGIATGTALVLRTDVRQQTPVTGTLGYAGSYSVIAPAGAAAGPGSASEITWLPATGATVARGDPAYAVNGLPVVLLYGTRPAWRDLAPGSTPGRTCGSSSGTWPRSATARAWGWSPTGSTTPRPSWPWSGGSRWRACR